jgi:hypothetical protein
MKTKSQVWWFTPVVPAAWKAEVGVSLEPGVRDHLGNIERPCLKTQKKKGRKEGGSETGGKMKVNK